MEKLKSGSPETLEFLRSRRSHPAVTMTEPGPSAEQIKDLLTIAARVPDHGKLSPWRFILYQGDSTHDIGSFLAARFEESNGPLDADQRQKELTRFSRAPLVVGVVSTAAAHVKIPVWEQQLSAGAVCMNLVTAAAAAGFASQWLTEWYSFDTEAVRFLGAGDGEQFAGFVHIGSPTQAPVERPRPDLPKLISEWTQSE